MGEISNIDVKAAMEKAVSADLVNFMKLSC
jgi:hypothetical protein